MLKCMICGRVRFFSLNFIFSKSICNECFMSMKTIYNTPSKEEIEEKKKNGQTDTDTQAGAK
jgi:hypothetical protein